MKKFRITIEERVEHAHIIEFETDLEVEKVEYILDDIVDNVGSLGETIQKLSNFKISKIDIDKGVAMEIDIPYLHEVKK